jgi:hypothetical protein
MAHRYLLIFALIGASLCGAIFVVAQPAPLPPASASDEVRSGQFQARVDDAARETDTDPRFKTLTHQQRRDLVEFAVGNTLFALVHEVGHALISEMGLPVLGREEDAADAYAVLAMLRVGTSLTHKVLVEAANGWFMSDRRAHREHIKPAFYDEHGLDQQRAFQIVCLMVGSDPDQFSDLANKFNMPEERQASCQGDYSNAKWSWDTLLKPHLRTPVQPKQTIDTVYGPAEGRLGVIAKAFRKVQLLETVATYEAERYEWRRPITFEMSACGKPWAHWDLSARKITVCYEVVADFGDLYRGYGLAQPKAYKQRRK